MRKLTKALLGSTVLTIAASAPALAVTLDETGIGDFPNFSPGTALNVGVDVVEGALNNRLDLDFFFFQGLVPGADIWLTFLNKDSGFDNAILSFTAFGDSKMPGVGLSEMLQGTADGFGNVEVSVIEFDDVDGPEGYTVSLEVHDVPEPASLALFGFGLAGIALGARRRRR